MALPSVEFTSGGAQAVARVLKDARGGTGLDAFAQRLGMSAPTLKRLEAGRPQRFSIKALGESRGYLEQVGLEARAPREGAPPKPETEKRLSRLVGAVFRLGDRLDQIERQPRGE